ncbi:hypothetical protein ACFSC6_03030 [Rufibacter sediminis]|uniref:Outer membrane protein beta-barrel domain-containing protein n=1 Tax=Rufibacter sediminis TaxID=2762756 RepID=A0ABR6VV97_9BACT|nr:hypothetical protein [Rufibacter sediminis]MBC3541128.1 hypothetical protein [Rufibacter sediminis]
MKKSLLVFLFAITVVFGAAAQTITPPQSTAPVSETAIQKGNWMIGAGIGSIGHNFKSETFSLEIEPRAGFFISDNAVIGAQVQLGLEAYNGGELFNYGITPFVRYYFPEGAAPTHRWFGEALVGFAGSNQEDSEGDRFFSSVYGVRAGYAHFVATNVSLEGTLNLVRSHANIDVGSGTSGSTGLSLGVAFQIYLPSRGQ